MNVDVVPLIRMPASQRGIFTYVIPEAIAPRAHRGAIALVPFRRRRIWSVIVRVPATMPLPARAHLRAIAALRDDYTATEAELATIERMADYSHVSYATAMYLSLPVPPLRGAPLSHAHPRSPRVRVSHTSQDEIPPLLREAGDTIIICRNGNQRRASIHAIAAAYVRKRRSVLLLTPHHVAIPELLEITRDLPSIVLDRSEGRIVAWRRAIAARQSGVVIIGTRSASFTAPTHLGAIICDHAESDDFKQYDAEPRFDARTVSADIAKSLRIPRYLVSPAPRVVDWARSDTRRVEIGAPPLDFQFVDLDAHWRSGDHGFLTEPLLHAIEDCLAARRLAVLLHNRRGRMRRTVCRDCGVTVRCPSCDHPYVEHADELRCHRCGSRTAKLLTCPACASPRLTSAGMGTASVVEVLQRQFSDARIVRIDRDTNHSSAEPADIIVGSERFLTTTAPLLRDGVGCIAVLHAECFVRGDEYRANELLMQALHRIAYWARTWHAPMIVQSAARNWPYWQYFPRALPAFYRADIAERRAFQYPPETRIVRCVRSAASDHGASASALLRLLQQRKIATLRLGEGPFLTRSARGAHCSVILRFDGAASDANIANALHEIPDGWRVDVDPLSMTP